MESAERMEEVWEGGEQDDCTKWLIVQELPLKKGGEPESRRERERERERKIYFLHQWTMWKI